MNYIQLCGHLSEGMKSNRYNTKSVNRYYINFHSGGNLHSLPKKELYAIYTSANMTNAKDYIDTQLDIDSTYKTLSEQFTLLNEMTNLDRMRFLARVRRQMDDFKERQ